MHGNDAAPSKSSYGLLENERRCVMTELLFGIGSGAALGIGFAVGLGIFLEGAASGIVSFLLRDCSGSSRRCSRRLRGVSGRRVGNGADSREFSSIRT